MKTDFIWYPHIMSNVSPPASSSWIQVNLGQLRKVTGIMVQGCPQYDYWLTKFKIQHSADGTSWTDYTADGPVSKQETTACRSVARRPGWRTACHSGSPWFAVLLRLVRPKHSWDSAAGNTCVGSVRPHPPGGVQRSGRASLRGLRVHTEL